MNATQDQRARTRRFWIFGVTAVSLITGALTFLRYVVQTAREDAQFAACTSHLKYIALALHNYHADFGSFPPAYVCGSDGRPWHSWRVLLLPYLQHKDIFELYSFDEPWDGPNNSRLADRLRKDIGCPVFQCSSDPSTGREGTNYVVIIGDGTMFPHDRSTRLADIRDGAENTIMVVEVVQSDIQWMEPRDLDATDMKFQINGAAGRSISSIHFHGKAASVVLADGQVRYLGNSVEERAIKAWITIAGGDNGDLPVIRFP